MSVGGAVQEYVVSVGSNPVALGSNGFPGRYQVSIFNPGDGGVLYYGGSAVASNTGLALASNATVTFSTAQGESVYGILYTGAGNTGSAKIRVLEW
jgi:hypothetical protein